jgi:hypothetical protein
MKQGTDGYKNHGTVHGSRRSLKFWELFLGWTEPREVLPITSVAAQKHSPIIWS